MSSVDASVAKPRDWGGAVPKKGDGSGGPPKHQDLYEKRKSVHTVCGQA